MTAAVQFCVGCRRWRALQDFEPGYLTCTACRFRYYQHKRGPHKRDPAATPPHRTPIRKPASAAESLVGAPGLEPGTR